MGYIAGETYFNMPHMETVCDCLLQNPSVSSRDGLSSGPRLLPAQPGGRARISAQGALCARASLCRVSLAQPKNKATTTAAEEVEGDGGCRIRGGWCPHAPHSQQLSWKDIAAGFKPLGWAEGPVHGSMSALGRPFPHVCTRVCWHAWASCPSPQRRALPCARACCCWPPAPLPVMSHVQHDDLLYRSHVLS